MADHHITDTIASVTSIATLVATSATAVIAWLVYRYQRAAEQPAVMVYCYWGPDAPGHPLLHIRGSILNRSTSPLAVHGISINKPTGCMIFEGSSASMYNRPLAGSPSLEISMELQPQGEVSQSKFMSGARDRENFRFTVFCPEAWTGGTVILDFDTSAPGRVEHRKSIRRVLDVGLVPPPMVRPAPPPSLIIPH